MLITVSSITGMRIGDFGFGELQIIRQRSYGAGYSYCSTRRQYMTINCLDGDSNGAEKVN